MSINSLEKQSVVETGRLPEKELPPTEKIAEVGKGAAAIVENVRSAIRRFASKLERTDANRAGGSELLESARRQQESAATNFTDGVARAREQGLIRHPVMDRCFNVLQEHVPAVRGLEVHVFDENNLTISQQLNWGEGGFYAHAARSGQENAIVLPSFGERAQQAMMGDVLPDVVSPKIKETLGIDISDLPPEKQRELLTGLTVFHEAGHGLQYSLLPPEVLEERKQIKREWEASADRRIKFAGRYNREKVETPRGKRVERIQLTTAQEYRALPDEAEADKFALELMREHQTELFGDLEKKS